LLHLLRSPIGTLDIARPQMDFRLRWKSGPAADMTRRRGLTHLCHSTIHLAVMQTVLCAVVGYGLGLRGAHEAPRFHHSARRCGCELASRGARAEGLDSSPHWFSLAWRRAQLEAFRQGLKEYGWIDGQNISVEYRFAEGKEDALPRLAGGSMNDAILISVG
jgi:hypothetical protein